MSDLGRIIRERVARALRGAGIEPDSGDVVQAGSVNSVVTGGSVRIEQATGGVCVGSGYAVVGGVYWLTQPGDVVRGEVLHRGDQKIAGTPVPNSGSQCVVETHMGQMWINGVHIPEYHGSRGGSTRQSI